METVKGNTNQPENPAKTNAETEQKQCCETCTYCRMSVDNIHTGNKCRNVNSFLYDDFVDLWFSCGMWQEN